MACFLLKREDFLLHKKQTLVVLGLLNGFVMEAPKKKSISIIFIIIIIYIIVICFILYDLATMPF